MLTGVAQCLFLSICRDWPKFLILCLPYQFMELNLVMSELRSITCTLPKTITHPSTGVSIKLNV